MNSGIIIFSILLAGTIGVANAESVPDWIKNTAGWWATDAISETEFVNAIEFLANEGIIEIENDCKFNGDGFSHLYEDMRMILCDDRFSEEFFQGKVMESGDMGGTIEGINSHGFRGSEITKEKPCLLYTSPSPRDATLSRMPSSA